MIMKPIPPNDPDPLLSGVLKEWKMKATLPPRFQERVWQRIALREVGSPKANWWMDVFGAVQSFLARPGLAASYVTALLVLGFAAGWTRGQEKSARVDHDLSSRYIQEIDPYHLAQDH
jgi:hypothetical protein